MLLAIVASLKGIKYLLLLGVHDLIVQLETGPEYLSKVILPNHDFMIKPSQASFHLSIFKSRFNLILHVSLPFDV